jgi:uncharacterized CHY-type Zn-finger protein
MTERKVVGDFRPERVLWYTRGGKAHLSRECQYIKSDNTNKHTVRELHNDVVICGWCDSDFTPENSMPRETLASTVKERITVGEINDDAALWDIRNRSVMHLSPDCHHLSDTAKEHSKKHKAEEVDNDELICETCILNNRNKLTTMKQY